jgi:hypothetical protein
VARILRAIGVIGKENGVCLERGAAQSVDKPEWWLTLSDIDQSVAEPSISETARDRHLVFG